MPSFDYKKNENTQEFLEKEKDKKIGSKCESESFALKLMFFLLQRE